MRHPFHKRSTRSIKGQIEEDECSGNTEVVVLNDEDEAGKATEQGSHRESPEPISAPSDADTSAKPKDRMRVSFGHLHVREFPVVMGDNPSVQFGGPPLRLEYDEGETECMMIGVDEYEMERGDRRTVAELRVPATLRRKWVGRNPKLERQVFRTQCQRRRTAARTDRDDWHFQLERMQRGMRKKLSLNKETQSQADHWCREYKKERQVSHNMIVKEPVKPQRWRLIWRQQRPPSRKEKQVQDISMFFV